jgi:hypothetical protein
MRNRFRHAYDFLDRESELEASYPVMQRFELYQFANISGETKTQNDKAPLEGGA